MRTALNEHETLRKVLFYGGALAILGLKVYGVLKGKLPWYLIVALGAIGVITEPHAVAAATLEDARKQGLIR